MQTISGRTDLVAAMNAVKPRSYAVEDAAYAGIEYVNFTPKRTSPSRVQR
ncbi:hypothetical protein MUU53_09160 [Rhizobium lemnae]|nr:hypothetical protein [Rhizobium lemnae]MCJ8508078.1 hypothetical protein [Rhizobium lemnae]